MLRPASTVATAANLPLLLAARRRIAATLGRLRNRPDAIGEAPLRQALA